MMKEIENVRRAQAAMTNSPQPMDVDPLSLNRDLSAFNKSSGKKGGKKQSTNAAHIHASWQGLMRFGTSA